MTEPSVAVWVYAVGVDLDGPWLAGATGVDGESLRVVSASGLTALVGSVDSGRFGAEGLRRRLDDLDQLEGIARRHHAAIALIAAHRPVAPARLATLYADDDRVRTAVRRHRDEFLAALRNVAGRLEWGVKAYSTGSEPDQPTPSAPTSGTAYLRQRQALLSARNSSWQRVVESAHAVHDRLSEIAVEAREHRPQDPNLSGDRRSMILNGAYLVDNEHAEEFATAVATLADEHPELAVELTGPWPAYSFAVVDDEQ